MAAPQQVVLTLDVGTSSVRGMLYDLGAGPRDGAEVKIDYRPRVRADGTAELDADRLVARSLRALAGALRTARGHDVLAVAVSTFWHGLVGLGADDRPATPLLLWSDTRSWRQARLLAEEVDASAAWARTGAPLHPSYWPAKLAWLRSERPDWWRVVRRWVSFADYLYLRLFGELGTSASMASGTGLRRLDGEGWDPELLRALDVAPNRLPPEVEEMQGLRAEHRGRFRRVAGVPWLTARGDGALANLGTDCAGPGREALTVGTSAALRVVTPRRPRQLPRGLWCYLVDRDRYLVGGSFSNGGNLHEWLVSRLRVGTEELEAALRRLPPASTHTSFLPLLSGERSPGFAAHAFGAVAPLTQATTALDVARAGLEAVAMSIAATAWALDEALGDGRQVVAGGGALFHSPAWCQVIADAIGSAVSTLDVPEASSRGAALVALQRAGVPPPRRLPIARTFRPRQRAHVAYREAYLRLGKLYGALIEDRLFEEAPAGPL
jgi:gluconokinase